MNPFAFEMGGRNQKTQLLRSRWAENAPELPDADPVVVLLESARDASDAGFPITLAPKPPSFADFSAEGVLAEGPRAASKGFPGDFGVFAEPNEAKAPDPRPKALDAPPVGEDNPLGVVTELKGFDFPCDELSPPNRFENVALRPAGLSPWPPELDVERESLLELEGSSPVLAPAIVGIFEENEGSKLRKPKAGQNSLGTATP